MSDPLRIVVRFSISDDVRHADHATERLSHFSAAVRDADSQAFARLMRHLRDVDGGLHTVLMVQVENEVGVIPESRDHSAAAEAAFAAAVPPTLVHFMHQHRGGLDPQFRAAWEDTGAKSAGARFNGDESSQGQALRLRGTDMVRGRIYKVRLYRYR